MLLWPDNVITLCCALLHGACAVCVYYILYCVYCTTANIIHFQNRFTRAVSRFAADGDGDFDADVDGVAAVYEFIVCAAFSHKYLQSACKKQKVLQLPEGEEWKGKRENLKTEYKLALMMVSCRAAWAARIVLGRHSISLLNAAVGHSTLLLLLLLLLKVKLNF